MDQATGYLRRTVLANPWLPVTPTPKQALFLSLPHLEAFYGGAAGGGKSLSLLMAALQYADTPGYNAILFRRSYPDLALPDALMDVARQWLGGTRAKWHDDTKTWEFPSSATLSFGYMEHPNDRFRYQSSQFMFVGFDEVTEFGEMEYRFMFSRLRRPLGLNVPLRMRSASNPGGRGHDWVKARFVDPGSRERPFVPARLEDNPFLDSQQYVRSLAELDPITRQQLLRGDWTVRHGGSLFRREWFEVMDEAPSRGVKWVRYWDLASTQPKDGIDPDWTAGALVGLIDGMYYITDVRHVQTTPAGVEALIRQTAEIDGHTKAVRMEQEPGASGVNTIDQYARRVLVGYDFRGIRSTGSKVERARPVSSAAEAGNVKLVRGPWIGGFLDEMEAFPEGSHDDQVDAISGAFAYFRPSSGRKGGTVQSLYGPLPKSYNPLGLDLSDPRYVDRDRS